MDAIEGRIRTAEVEPAGVFPPMDVQAFPVASAAGIEIFRKGFQSFHDDTPAFRAETPDALEGLAVNQNPERQKFYIRITFIGTDIQCVNWSGLL